LLHTVCGCVATLLTENHLRDFYLRRSGHDTADRQRDGHCDRYRRQGAVSIASEPPACCGCHLFCRNTAAKLVYCSSDDAALAAQVALTVVPTGTPIYFTNKTNGEPVDAYAEPAGLSDLAVLYDATKPLVIPTG
jgi:hypothetical protein